MILSLEWPWLDGQNSVPCLPRSLVLLWFPLVLSVLTSGTRSGELLGGICLFSVLLLIFQSTFRLLLGFDVWSFWRFL